MSLRIRLLNWIEPTNNIWLGLVDADPRTSPGLADAGIGSIAEGLDGNRYKKTGSGATAWTLVTDAASAALHGSGNPTSGTSGTGANVVAIGGMYIDDATGQRWINVGTLASPSWVPQVTGEPV